MPDERNSDPRLAADDLVGSIMFFAGPDQIPKGWLTCDGKAYLRADYPRLYAVIGSRYGVGDPPNSTFRVPDLSGLVPVGVGSTDSELNKKIGEKVGASQSNGRLTLSASSSNDSMHGSRQGNLEAGDPFTFATSGHSHTGTTTASTIQPGMILRSLIKAQ